MAIEDDLVKQIPLTSYGELARAKRLSKVKLVAKAQSLSEIGDGKVLPPNYVPLYNRLRVSNPTAARELWNKWAFEPKADVVVDTKALNVLNRLEMPPRQPLKRRI